MSVRLPALLIAALVSLNAQSVPSTWEWAQPDAKIVAGIDVRGLRESSFVQKAGPLWTGQAQPGLDLSKFHIPGIELLNDIDRVLISSTGEMKAAPVAAGVRHTAAAPQSPAPAFLLVLEGDFPASHYQPLLQGVKRMYRTFAVYKTSKTGDGAIAIVNSRTLLIGDEKSVFGALDRHGRTPALSNALLTRAAELAASSDFWLIANSLPMTTPSADVSGAMGMAAQLASQLDGVELGASLKEGLRLDFAITAKTEATAQMMVALVTAQMQMAANNPNTPQAAEFLDKLQVSAQGARMTMHVALSQEELDRQMQAVQSARMAGVQRRSQPSGTAATVPSESKPLVPQPEAPGPRKIRIVGLDDGVREIPLAPAVR